MVPGFPSGTTETYVSHIVKRPLVGRKGDRAGNHLAWIRTAMLTQGTRWEPNCYSQAHRYKDRYKDLTF